MTQSIFSKWAVLEKLVLLNLVLAAFETNYTLSDLKVLHLPLSLQEMICAIAELESDRKPLIMKYNKKTKETGLGILQIFAKTAEWLVGYKMISCFPLFQENLTLF